MPPAKKMGRPPAENLKCETWRVRVDKDVVKKLDDCAGELGITRSDIVRKGIDLALEAMEK